MQLLKNKTNKQTKKVKVETFSKSNQFKNEIEYLGKKTILILSYPEIMFYESQKKNWKGNILKLILKLQQSFGLQLVNMLFIIIF